MAKRKVPSQGGAGNLRRGRPHKPLAEDPDRYWLALTQAHIFCGKQIGISTLRVVETFAGLKHGRPIKTPENLAAMARGERYAVATEKYRSDPNKADWRNKNAFRAIADDLRRKIRRIRSGGGPNAQWLADMSAAWFMCLQGFPELEDRAEDLASFVGERAYFDTVMRPMLHARSEQRKAGLKRAEFTLFDFLPS
jgi:hypothetical protein